MTAQVTVRGRPVYHDVGCSGCRRVVGISLSENPLRNAVWCEPACMTQPIVSENELRDDLMIELSRERVADQAIGDLFGLSRSRVQRIVSRRTPQVIV